MLHSRKKSLAWLPCLEPSTTSKGPWILSDNHTARFLDGYHQPVRKITADSLLMLAASVLTIPTPTSGKVSNNSWGSPDSGYCVKWCRPAATEDRLFVQNADAYFARIELFINGMLLVAFNDPLWPHLQKESDNTNHKLTVPCHFLDAIETKCLSLASEGGNPRKVFASSAPPTLGLDY
jgi:hypothetical protein